MNCSGCSPRGMRSSSSSSTNPAPGLPPHSHSLRGFRVPEMSDLVLAPGLTRAIAALHRAKGHSTCPGLRSWLVCHAGGLSRRAARSAALRAVERRVGCHASSAAMADAGASRRIVARRRPPAWPTARARRPISKHLGAATPSIVLTGNTAGYVFERDDRAHLARVRSEWGIGDRPVVLFLGRLIPVKAPEISGGGICRRRCAPSVGLPGRRRRRPPAARSSKPRRQGLGLTSVHFTRQAVEGQSREGPALSRWPSVFVLPSRRTRIAEAWGLVLNEAASAGLPIVVSESVGAVGDLIRPGESGMVVPDADDEGARRGHPAVVRSIATRRSAWVKQRSEPRPPSPWSAWPMRSTAPSSAPWKAPHDPPACRAGFAHAARPRAALRRTCCSSCAG